MEQVPNSFPHLFLGYSIIFGILMVYVFILTRRASRLEKQVLELEEKNSRKG